MTKWIVGAAIAIMLIIAPAAQGITTAEAPYAEWLAEAKMPPLPVLEVVPAEARCNVALDCTDTETFIAMGRGEGPRAFLHEEGHVFAAYYVDGNAQTEGNAQVEERIAGLIGHPKLQWHLYNGDGSLDEAFADSFARCGIVRMGYPILARWNGYSVGSVLIRGARLIALCSYIRSL